MTDRSSTGATELGYSRRGQALYVLIPALVGAGLGWARYALHEEQLLVVEKPNGYGRPVEGGKQFWRLTNRPDSLDA